MKYALSLLVSLLILMPLGGCDEGLIQIPEEEEKPEIVITIPDVPSSVRPDLQQDYGYAHFQSLLDYFMSQGRDDRAWSLCWSWRVLNDMVAPGVYSPEPRGCPEEDPFA